ncbi:MAG: glycosyltransferase, partial [Caldithrix sp.]|nr:glycosyltransferase [Caldithrix sp.]
MEPLSNPLSEALTAFNTAQDYFLKRQYDAAEDQIALYKKSINYEQFNRTDNRIEIKELLVSVVIVSYKGNQGLLECLEALNSQTDERFEVILVNNGANESVEDELDQKPLLHIRCPQNMILSEGRNIGSYFAKGKYLAFLDDDAIVSKDYIESIIRAFTKYRIAGFRGKVLPKKHEERHQGINHYNLGDRIIPFMINTEGNSAFRKNIYQEFGGMHPLLFGHEGWEISSKIVKKYGTPSLIYWPETVVYHDYSDTDQKSDRKQRRHHLMHEYIQSRHGNAKKYRKSVKKQLSNSQKQEPSAKFNISSALPDSVAYVHSGEWPSNSPSTTFITYNVLGMASVFEHVYLITYGTNQTKVDTIFYEQFGVSKPSNLHIVLVNSVLQKLTNRAVYKKIQRILQNLVKKNALSAIITRRSTLLRYLWPVADRSHVPLLFESHDFFADLSRRHDIDYKRKKRAQILERNYIPIIQGVICLQPTQIDLYRSIFPHQNFFLARTGIWQIIPPGNAKRKYLTYIGSLDRHKGI